MGGKGLSVIYSKEEKKAPSEGHRPAVESVVVEGGSSARLPKWPGQERSRKQAPRLARVEAKKKASSSRKVQKKKKGPWTG